MIIITAILPVRLTFWITFESLFPSHIQCPSSSSHIIQFMGISYEFLFSTNFLFLKNDMSFFLIKITCAQGQKWENTKDMMEKRFKKGSFLLEAKVNWCSYLLYPHLYPNSFLNLYCQGKAIALRTVSSFLIRFFGLGFLLPPVYALTYFLKFNFSITVDIQYYFYISFRYTAECLNNYVIYKVSPPINSSTNLLPYIITILLTLFSMLYFKHNLKSCSCSKSHQQFFSIAYRISSL